MKRYIFAGLLVFLIVLVTTFPARIAYNWFVPADIKLTGVDGSIWNGRADEGLVGGAYLRNLSWKFKPGSLLTGKLAFAAAAEPAAGSIRTDVALALDGSLMLSNLTGSLPLDMVHDSFQQNGIRGDVQIDFAGLTMLAGLPVNVEGTVTINNFFVAELSSTRLGDYQIQFTSADGNVSGSIDDLSGVLDVSGEVTLAADRSFSLLGAVAARPNAPPSVTQQLQFLGTPDAQGFRPFRFEGSL